LEAHPRREVLRFFPVRKGPEVQRFLPQRGPGHFLVRFASERSWHKRPLRAATVRRREAGGPQRPGARANGQRSSGPAVQRFGDSSHRGPGFFLARFAPERSRHKRPLCAATVRRRESRGRSPESRGQAPGARGQGPGARGPEVQRSRGSEIPPHRGPGFFLACFASERSWHKRPLRAATVRRPEVRRFLPQRGPGATGRRPGPTARGPEVQRFEDSSHRGPGFFLVWFASERSGHKRLRRALAPLR
jgi:hypothetical protein